MNINVNDSVITAEVVGMNALPISVFDASMVVDKPVYYDDTVILSEKVTINSFQAPDINISVNDAPVTSEALDVLRARIRDIQDVSDSITTSESVTFLDSPSINVSETVKTIEGWVNMLNYNGTNQTVVTSFNAALHPLTSVSVEGWAYHKDWDADTAIRDIYSNADNGGYALRINDTGQTLPAVGLTVRANNSFRSVSASMATLPPGWHLFLGTFDGRFLKIYIDGLLQQTKDLGGTFAIQYSFNNGSGIGSDVDSSSPAVGTGNYWSEAIGQVRVYSNRVLNATEALQHFNQNYVDESNLASAYYFPEGTGSTTADVTGIANGTLVNSPIWTPNTMPQAGLIGLDENFSVSDATTTSESVSITTTEEPFAGDDVTTSESVTVFTPFMGAVTGEDVTTDDTTGLVVEEDSSLLVFDAATTSESTNETFVLLINVSDSTTTSEAVAFEFNDFISVSDTSTTFDLVLFTGVPTLAAVDIATTSESITMENDNFVSVFDAPTVSESVSIVLISNISVNDATTTSESITIFSNNNISVNDATTTSESVTVYLNDLFIMAERVNNAEVITMLLSVTISVSDATTTSESLTVDAVDLALVSDATTTSESVTIYSDINSSVNDATTTSEDIEIFSDNSLFVEDDTATDEDVEIFMDASIFVSDATTASEATNTIFEDENISVSDSTTTSEARTVDEIDLISVSDVIITSESDPVVEGAVIINVNDSTTISELFILGFNTLDIIVSDSSATSEVVIAGQIQINVSETVTISEFSNAQYPRDIAVFDSVSHIDFARMKTPDAPPPVPQANTATEEPNQVYVAWADGGENW